MPEIISNLHPLFVHFPIALISVSALFHITAIAACGKSYASHCAVIAHATLWLGALAALPTVFFGWQAFNSVNHDDVSHVAMLIHRNWALGTSIVLIILASWDVWRNKVDSSPVWCFVVVVIGAWSMVTITAWHGGELVYRHGLGVMSLPKPQDGVGHGQHRDSTTSSDEHYHADIVPDDQAHVHSQHDHIH